MMLSPEELEQLRDFASKTESVHGWRLKDLIPFLLVTLPHNRSLSENEIFGILKMARMPADRHSISKAMIAMDRDVILDQRYGGKRYQLRRDASQNVLQKLKLRGLEPTKIGETVAESEPEKQQVSKTLRETIDSISDGQVREFADETFRCIQVDALRSAVVMSWNLAYQHLKTWVFKRYLVAFNDKLTNTWLNKRNQVPRPPVASIEDFDDLKESFVIEQMKAAKLINEQQRKILEAALVRRNRLAHPNSNTIDQPQASGHVSELLEMFVCNPLFQ